MKKIALLILWLGLAAGHAATAPAFPPGIATFVSAFTNTFDTYQPSGVVVADLFGTGHPALIAANFMGNYLTILTNNGSGVFSLNAQPIVGNGPNAVVATNVTGSGHLDLLALNTEGSTVSVLTNNGAGGFSLSDTIGLQSGGTSGDQAFSFTVADIYNNGKPAVITASSQYNTLTVYTNAGGGIFGSNVTYNLFAFPLTGAPVFVTAADVNGDGFVDLVCTSENGYLLVLTNNGSGRFVSSDTLTVQSGSEPVAVAVADIYNNGKPALITANKEYGTLFVYTNTGGGIFGSNATLNVNPVAEPSFVAAADVNGDGSLDLICANLGLDTLVVFTNNGSGRFTPACTNGGFNAPAWVAAGNIFGNGKADLVVVGAGEDLNVLSNTTPFYQRTFTVGKATNLLVSASGSPAPAFAATSPLPGGVTLIDNGNGTATLTGTPVITSGGVYPVTLTASNSVSIATQTVTLTVNQPPIFPGGELVPAAVNFVNNNLSHLTLADLYNTGQSEVISPYVAGIMVYTNAGGGLFDAAASFNPFYPLSTVLVADVYGTGQPALIGIDPNASQVTVLTNNGSGNFSINTTLNVDAAPITAVTADIFGTGKLALITADYDTSTLTVFTNNGSAFHPCTTLGTGIGPQSPVAVDLNGDGHVDLVCANFISSTLTVLTNNGSGGLVNSQTIALPTSYRPVSVTVADIYNNGKPALIAASTTFGTLTVYTNAGSGIFGSNATYNANTTFVVAADVNNDGHVDLITGNGDGDQLIVLTNNGAGHFVTASPNTPLYLGQAPGSLAAADLNGDGRVDLIYATTTGPAVLGVYTNGAILPVTYTETLFHLPQTPAPASGWPATARSGTSGTLPAGLTYSGGTLSGTPGPNTTGAYNFFITETNALGTSTETLALTVNPVVIAPAQTFALDENHPLTLTTNTLFATDYDLDNEPLSLTAASATSTSGGTVVFASGSLTYTPAANYTGTDTFTYTISDTAGDIAQGLVTLTVYPPPVTGPTILSTPENTTLVFAGTTVLANDSDPAGQTLSISADSPSAQGGPVYTETLNGSIPDFAYLPPSNFTGLDTVTCTVTDPLGGATTGLVQIIVTAPGSPAYNTAAITAPSSSQLTLQYTGQPDTSYYLQTATNLTGPWTDQPPALTTDPNGLITQTLTNTPATPAQYYRLSTQP